MRRIMMCSHTAPMKFVRVVKRTMNNRLGQDKGGFGQPFEVLQGLSQGNGLAPLFFNLTLESVISKSNNMISRLLMTLYSTKISHIS